MKNVYFGIKYFSDNRNRALIEEFESCFSKQGFKSYCVVRDMEKWGEVSYPATDIMQETFAKIDSSELVVIDVSEKGIGLGIEAGYAKAKGKELVITVEKGVGVSKTIKGIADRVIEYDSVSEIRIL